MSERNVISCDRCRSEIDPEFGVARFQLLSTRLSPGSEQELVGPYDLCGWCHSQIRDGLKELATNGGDSISLLPASLRGSS